jgi:hypothetical protein
VTARTLVLGGGFAGLLKISSARWANSACARLIETSRFTW